MRVIIAGGRDQRLTTRDYAYLQQMPITTVMRAVLILTLWVMPMCIYPTEVNGG